jgi:hypothetical protein
MSVAVFVVYTVSTPQNAKRLVIFDKTRTPLTTWFDAAWHVTTAKNGMSARTLERTMGVSYQVAWNIV